jgi:elongation factor P--(R)-beta-lysine ligase
LYGLAPTTISCGQFLLDTQAWFRYISSPKKRVLINDYPPSQAALARIRPGPVPVAERFECYLEGMELANGFRELTDPDEHRQRFAADLAPRRTGGFPAVPLDDVLLAALAAGLPDSAGVAVGLERLLMLALGADHIDAVLSIPLERA